MYVNLTFLMYPPTVLYHTSFCFLSPSLRLLLFEVHISHYLDHTCYENHEILVGLYLY